jgi:hypothetical protein
MPPATDHLRRRGIRRWFLGPAIFAIAVATAFLIRPSRNSPHLHDSRFVVTTRPTLGLPPGATLTQRAFTWWYENRHRFQKPRPLAYSFSASQTTRCSIHGLLNQCMEITGTRYVIAKDVAAGTIEFGHTNTLNGTQWVAAFTEALQNSQPEWWDPQAKRFHKENLALITNDARTVLVLPKAMAQEFRARGAD